MKPCNKIFCSLIALSASLALISCGGGQAGTPPPQNPPSQNPQPSITSVAPTSVPAGGSDFILTVNGAGFVTASEIRWNGAPRGTTFVSSTILTAQILANDIAASGSAEVTVFNPAPGGGASSAMTFTIIATAAGGFSPAGNMRVPRQDHTATLLPNGQVLVAGGVSLICCDPVSTSELFDPKTNQFHDTGPMSTARYAHTATLLLDGRVLLAGGLAPPGPNIPVQALLSAELYDPATGTFTPTGSMVDARSGHTATLLSDGKVLVTGGRDENLNVWQWAEIYDPAIGSFTLTGNTMEPRAYHTAVLLDDGKVLVAGGYGRCDPDGCNSLASAEIFNPTSGAFTPTASLANERDSHSATLLSNRRVVVAGGEDQVSGLGPVGSYASAETFDPVTGIFSSASATMTTSRFAHTATLLPNGRILLTGGTNCFSDMADCHRLILSSAELFDPVSATFFITGSMVKKRSGHRATLLLDGRVLITGGSDDNSAELYE